MRGRVVETVVRIGPLPAAFVAAPAGEGVVVFAFVVDDPLPPAAAAVFAFAFVAGLKCSSEPVGGSGDAHTTCNVDPSVTSYELIKWLSVMSLPQ